MEEWACQHCKEINDADCDFCFGCGTYRAPTEAVRNKNLPPSNIGAPIQHEAFGNLYWDESGKEWVGVYPPSAEFPFRISVPPQSRGDRSPAESACVMIRQLDGVLPNLPMVIAKAMLQEAIEWVEGSDEFDPSEPPLTEQEFAKRIEPHAIRFDASGTLEIAYLDDEIFEGHWIVVDMEPDGKLGNFRIEG